MKIHFVFSDNVSISGNDALRDATSYTCTYGLLGSCDINSRW